MSQTKRKYKEERLPVVITDEPWDEIDGELPIDNVIVLSSAPKKTRGHQIVKNENNQHQADVIDFVSVRYARKRLVQKIVNSELAARWAFFFMPMFLSYRRRFV